MTVEVVSIPKIHYEAKWPEKLNPALKSLAHKVARVVWDLLSIIIFPIFLARMAFKWLKNKVLRVIVPGNIDKDLHLIKFKTTWEWIKAICLFLTNSEHFKINRDAEGKKLLSDHGGHSLTLTTPDGVKLDGAFFPGKIKDKVIIFAKGNTGQWENHTQKLAELLKLNTSLLMVNPRGVGKNKGHRSEEGYALDIYTAYDFLIREKKFDPNEIVLVGFSMGGGYGTCGAAITQDQYPEKEIKVMNINSFSDLQTEVETMLQGRGLLKFIGRIAAQVLRLELHPKKAWDKLKGEKWIIYNPKDEIIPKPASLYRAVKSKPVGTTKVIKLHGTDTSHEHHRPFYEDEIEAMHTALLSMLKIDRSQTTLDPIPIPTTLKIKTFSA